MANPFKKVVAYDKEEMISKAFRDASKKAKNAVIKGTGYEKAFQKEGIRIKYASDSLYTKMKDSVNSFPNLNELPDIYRELLDLIIGKKKLEENLQNITWSANRIKKLQMNYLVKLKKTRTTNQCRDLRKDFYGRATSYLRKYKKQIQEVYLASIQLRNLPDFEDVTTVIIAGLPNVGKSSILRCLTGARPKVQSYPFTTKGLMLGFRDFRFKKVQFIDTPGLLDRSLKKRNKIEMQAIVVLKHLANIIVYIFDISETSGYSLEEQMKLYKEIKKLFKKKMIAVVNKVDVEGMRELEELKLKNIPVSCETKKGIDDLLKEIKESI